MPKKLPLILLPPSEGKMPGGSGPCWEPSRMQNDLDGQRLRLMDVLSSYMAESEKDRSKLLGVKGVALEAATEANLALGNSPTMPAIERYTGVLYEALDVASLSSAAKRRLDRSLVIFSGLFGLVAPGDPIPDYKLKMGATVPGVGKVSSFWRNEITRVLAEQTGGRQVWNLLPNEHDAAWADSAGPVRTSVRFLEPRSDGTLVAVSHWNKFFKGALVRHLLEEPDTTPESLVSWCHPAGWTLDPSLEQVVGNRRSIAFVRNF